MFDKVVNTPLSNNLFHAHAHYFNGLLFLSNYRILKSIGPELFTCYLNPFVIFCKGVPVDVSKGVLLLSAECKSIKFAYSYNITQVFASRDLKQPVRLCLFPAALKQPVRLSG